MVENGATKGKLRRSMPNHPDRTIYDWHKRLSVTYEFIA
jgi:hypothetical protein